MQCKSLCNKCICVHNSQCAMWFLLSQVSSISALHRSTPSANMNCWRILFSSDESIPKCTPNMCQLFIRCNLFRRRLTSNDILRTAHRQRVVWKHASKRGCMSLYGNNNSIVYHNCGYKTLLLRAVCDTLKQN